jgi:Protein of unknown function (DUF2577)
MVSFRPQKLGRLEGSGSSRLLQLMKIQGYNVEVEFELGKVVSLNPLRIRLNTSELLLESDDLIVAGSLLKHTRRMKFEDGRTEEVEVQDALEVGDKVIMVEADNGQIFYVLDKAVI